MPVGNKDEMKRTMETKIPPPIIALLHAALMYGIDQIWPQQWLAPPLALLAGVLLASPGILLDGFGVWQFLRAHTTINPLRPQRSSALVTDGLYRVSRNPMYLGMLLLLCGWSVYLANLLALPVLGLFVLTLNRLQIQPEERILRELFGQPYLDYCQRVRRWL